MEPTFQTMTPQQKFDDAFERLKAGGMSDEEAKMYAGALVRGEQVPIEAEPIPLAEAPQTPEQYVASELRQKGGFIGDPNKPGSNVFVSAPQISGITSYSAPRVMPPWMVQQAGAANELPGINPQAAEDFKDAYGKDPRELYDEGKLAVAAVKGAAGDVSEQVVNDLDAAYKDAFDRYTKVVMAGADPLETETALYGPLRATAKALVVENRYREDYAPEGLSWIEKRQYSDAMTRLRTAEELLGNKKKRMESLVSESDLQKQVKQAKDIMDRLEAKSGGSAPSIVPAGGNRLPSTQLKEGQRVRNRKTGQMGTVRNGVVVPD